MASPEDFFTVVVRDQRFVLTRSQIDFDAPNYFTMCFLGDFTESQSRQVVLSRDPHLFKIIVDYLCGYAVLPIRQDVLPPTMSLEVALANLRADAIFYQLSGLLAEIDKPPPVEEEEEEPIAEPVVIEEPPPPPPNLLLADVRRQELFRNALRIEGWTESPDMYKTYGE